VRGLGLRHGRYGHACLKLLLSDSRVHLACFACEPRDTYELQHQGEILTLYSFEGAPFESLQIKSFYRLSFFRMVTFCTVIVAVLGAFIPSTFAQTAPGFPVSTERTLNVTFGSNNVDPAGELLPRPGRVSLPTIP